MPEHGWHSPTLPLVKSQNSSAAQGANVGLGDGTAVGLCDTVGANVGLGDGSAVGAGVAVGANVPP